MATRNPTSLAPAAAGTLQRVGVLGLGIMGSAMAGNLLKAGFAVSGHDLSAPARQRLRSAGGGVCADAGALAASVDVLITSLPSAGALLHCAERIAAASPARGLLVVGLGHAKHDTAAVFDVLDRMSSAQGAVAAEPTRAGRRPRGRASATSSRAVRSGRGAP